jgi:hypothetical protein
MNCSPPCWDYTHRSGRCKCGTDATRAALGMRTLGPLHQDDGGHIVRGAMSFPIEREEEDEPVTTPERSAWAVAQAILAFVGVSLLALSAANLIAK